jgi:hypothetical protein
MKTGRKVGTTKSAILPNGKAFRIKRPEGQKVPQKITALSLSKGKGENAR